MSVVAFLEASNMTRSCTYESKSFDNIIGKTIDVHTDWTRIMFYLIPCIITILFYLLLLPDCNLTILHMFLCLLIDARFSWVVKCFGFYWLNMLSKLFIYITTLGFQNGFHENFHLFYGNIFMKLTSQRSCNSVGSSWLLEKLKSWPAYYSRWIWWRCSLSRKQDSYDWSVQAWALSWSSGLFFLCFETVIMDFSFYFWCSLYILYALNELSTSFSERNWQHGWSIFLC